MKLKKSIGIFEEGKIYKIYISNIEEVDENNGIIYYKIIK